MKFISSTSKILLNVCIASVILKQTTMKVFGILLIFCVSKAYSQLNGVFGGNIQGGIQGGIQSTLHGFFCGLGTVSGKAAAHVSSMCTSLPGQNNDLGFDGKPALKECTKAAKYIGHFSKKFLKYCQDTSAATTVASTTQSTSTPAPTTPTTETPETTTPMPCPDDEERDCIKQCKKRFDANINFGEVCTTIVPQSTYRCRCKTVEHCETYTNATCKMQCKDNSICRIPEKNLPCVCKVGSTNHPQYRLPNSTMI